MTMELSDICTEIAQRRKDASKTDTDTTGNRYVREVVGQRDDDGTIRWQSNATVNPWALWLREERDKTLWDATKPDLRAHLRAMQRADYAAKTKGLRLSAISIFHKELVRMEEQPEHDLPETPPENPADKLDPDEKREFGISDRQQDTKKSQGLQDEDIHAPSPEDVKAMCNNVPGNGPRALRDELLIKLMAWCGLRRSEVATAKEDHINRDEWTIYVPPSKSETDRKVPLPDEKNFKLLLEQWLDHGYRDAVAQSYSGTSDYLFPTQESAHIDGYSVNRIVKQAAENAGIQEEIGDYARENGNINKITAHSLRHHYGVQAIHSDIPITYLRDLMGHHSTSVTEVYLDLATDDTVAVGRRFSPEATPERD